MSCFVNNLKLDRVESKMERTIMTEDEREEKYKRTQLAEIAKHVDTVKSILDSQTSFNSTLSSEQQAIIFLNYITLLASTGMAFVKSELDGALPKQSTSEDKILHQNAINNLSHIYTVLIQQLNNLKPVPK